MKKQAIWNGQVIAESDDLVNLEGNYYFPLASVKPEYLQKSSHTSICPWKGTAHYYSLHIDGEDNKNAVWYYPTPKDAAKEISGRVAFWKGVEVKDA
jgi:uncharacterized protein (DUF427 family)